jgi:branched-subunit amino acid ABC-type transport system permease component
MEGFLHQLLSGLANGGVYASVALALVMIYQATHLVNFAQGEMAMFSTYIAWAMIDAGFPYWAAFSLTLVFSFAAGVAIERIIIRPVERCPELTIVSCSSACCSSSIVWPGGFSAIRSRAFLARFRQPRGTAANICRRTRWA